MSLRCERKKLFAAEVRRQVAEQMGYPPATLRMMLLLGDASIEELSTRKGAPDLDDASEDDVDMKSAYNAGKEPSDETTK